MAGKKSFPLRINADIYQAIEMWANDELRSVNGHIEFLLREALKKAGACQKMSLSGRQIRVDCAIIKEE